MVSVICILSHHASLFKCSHFKSYRWMSVSCDHLMSVAHTSSSGEIPTGHFVFGEFCTNYPTYDEYVKLLAAFLYPHLVPPPPPQRVWRMISCLLLSFLILTVPMCWKSIGCEVSRCNTDSVRDSAVFGPDGKSLLCTEKIRLSGSSWDFQNIYWFYLNINNKKYPESLTKTGNKNKSHYPRLIIMADSWNLAPLTFRWCCCDQHGAV